MDHADPFQRSTSGSAICTSPVGIAYPTATHALRDVHETSDRLIALDPAGIGASCTDQSAAEAAALLTRHTASTSVLSTTGNPRPNATPLNDVGPMARLLAKSLRASAILLVRPAEVNASPPIIWTGGDARNRR
jgi:hypothetical protein